jgi:hypothetical protein
MVDPFASLVMVFGAVFVPIAIGGTIGVIIGETTGRKPVMIASAIGILVWLFLDLMSDSSFLDVNRGLEGGWGQVAIFITFVAGLGILVLVDHDFLDSKPAPTYVALLAAVAMGFHSAGEAMELGGALATVGLDVILGLPALSFILHKILEGFVLSAFLVVGVQTPSFKRSMLQSAIVGAFALLAEPLGYLSLFESSYFFAMGAGGTIYMIWRLVFHTSGSDGRTLVLSGFVIGFIFVYLAALLHAA